MKQTASVSKEQVMNGIKGGRKTKDYFLSEMESLMFGKDKNCRTCNCELH